MLRRTVYPGTRIVLFNSTRKTLELLRQVHSEIESSHPGDFLHWCLGWFLSFFLSFFLFLVNA